MKKNNFVKRTLLAATFALAVAVLVPSAGQVEANAAPKKVTGHANYKKAPKIKLNKTYTVTSKSKNGTYVKFTASKAGKYQVSISNLRSYKSKSVDTDMELANFYIRKAPTSSYSSWLPSINVKTQGGKSDVLFVGTPASYNAHYKGKPAKTFGYYPQKRTATFSMKKGETIYVNMHFFTGKKNRCTYNLQIKRK